MIQDDPKVEISAIKAQLESIQRSIDDVKKTVTHLADVGTSVAVLEQHGHSRDEAMQQLSERVDRVELRLTNNSAYLNKMKGGFGLAMTLMTLIQGSVLAGAGWLLSSVIETREVLMSVQESMRYIEQEQSRIIQAFLAETSKNDPK